MKHQVRANQSYSRAFVILAQRNEQRRTGRTQNGNHKIIAVVVVIVLGGVKKSKAYLLANVLVRQYMKICAFGKVLWNFFYLKISRRRRREYRRIVSIITSMIIRENRIIDQFPTPKHQQIWLPF